MNLPQKSDEALVYDGPEDENMCFRVGLCRARNNL
jgi:hypothetical protein